MQIRSAETASDSDAEDERNARSYYVTDPVQQGQYIKMFKEQGV